ncbi:NAD(P)H-binding protein [Pediococcus pentosaceus]|uniref:NAD(P)H-binding protein n=1 Tax=Pediococcus pentosaceus TaxID=1255 RepID=UPI00223A8395|nr:NAD(P)H-binding protein [Pediococcus pentosaceus]MCS8569779.1 NAD-dependent epimerase/dehydratase family protein [Pediococcus pentosaceus]
MKNVLILGATSNISKYLIPKLLNQSDVHLTLFARKATQRLAQYADEQRITLVDGDWNQPKDLQRVMDGQEIVFMATGHFEQANRNVVSAMKNAQVTRIIIAGGLGIYDEVVGKFGEWNARMMGDYTSIKKAALVFDQSGLDYTFLRMSWLYDQDGNENFELVPKGQPMKGTQVTRQAVANFIAQVVEHPEYESQQSVGIVEPNTAWDKPSFY